SFQPAADGTGRYRLLEYVRQYGGEHLEHSRMLDYTRARHADHYSRLVKHVVPELSGTAPEPARTILDREDPNVRAALTWLIAVGDTERAWQFGADLSIFWYPPPRSGEGLYWAAQLMALEGRFRRR